MKANVSGSVRKMSRAHGSTVRAFTLLEVLLVIVILVTLAAVVLPQFMGQEEKAKIDTTKLQLKSIENALDLFKANIGRYPTTEEGIGVLNSKDALDDEDLEEKWHGPYMGKEGEEDFTVEDAWNNDFRYTSPGEHNEKTFDLSSDGPDGEEDSDDDIKNWEDD